MDDYSNTPVFLGITGQDRHYSETEWTVRSIDIVLGIIGGFIGLIWDLLGFSLGGYQSYKFNMAMMNETYSTREAGEGHEPNDVEQAHDDLKRGVETRSRYTYSYSEYLGTWLLTKLCCCCSKCACFSRR